MKRLIPLLIVLAVVLWGAWYLYGHPQVEGDLLRNATLILEGDFTVSHLTQGGVFDETNIARKAEAGLPPLDLSQKLSQIAELRLKDMFEKQYFEHYSPQGVGAPQIAEQEGYGYVVIGENIALGNFKDDKTLVDAWMASPGHRANILNTRFTEIGIAVGKGDYQGRSRWLAVQVFARPLSLCPSIDMKLKGSIDLEEARIDRLKKEADVFRQAGNIQEYNALVPTINSSLKDLQGMIAIYNGQVQRYNSCIKK